MRLESYGTAGARRRMRYHVNADRAIQFTGTFGDAAEFRVVGDDGRTYEVTLNPEDMAEVTKGALAVKRKRELLAKRAGGNGSD